MRTKFLYLLFMISLLSCHSNQKYRSDKASKLKKHEIILKINNPIKLSYKAAKLIGNWKEYNNFKNLFAQYQATTPSEALSNADELNTLATQLKDSIRNKSLKTIPFKARLDVLQNETMRLKDMVAIPNLTTSDIKAQIDKILAAYNATIAKLNNLAVQMQIETELDNMAKDTIKDSVGINGKKQPKPKPIPKQLKILKKKKNKS